MNNAGLVMAARQGDRDALVAMYDRYADRLHDFCLSMLREPDEAASALQATFKAAEQRLDKLKEPSRLRAWLFALAHAEVCRRLKRRQQPKRRGRKVPVVMTPVRPGQVASRTELQDVVWDAVTRLPEEDRFLLDLHLRQRLKSDELAEVLDLREKKVEAAVDDLRDRVDRSIGAILVARAGRPDCPTLAGALEEDHDARSPVLESQVTRHVDHCATCAERRRTMVSPLTLLATVPATPAPAWLHPNSAEQLAPVAPEPLTNPDGVPTVSIPPLAAATGDAATGDEDPEAEAAAAARRRRDRWLALTACLGVAAVALWRISSLDGTSLETLGEEGGRVPAEAVAPTPATTLALPELPTVPPEETTTTTSPVVVPPGAALTVVPTNLDLGDATATSSVDVANSSAAPFDWRAETSAPWLAASPPSGRLSPGEHATVSVQVDRTAVSEGVLQGTITLTAGDNRSVVAVAARVERPPAVSADIFPDNLAASGCSPAIATVTVTVNDEQAVPVVDLHWTASDGTGGSVPMVPAGSSFIADLGPYPPGTASWWVVAEDGRGNRTTTPERSLPVNVCVSP